MMYIFYHILPLETVCTFWCHIPQLETVRQFHGS
jgi:hypothetical protein